MKFLEEKSLSVNIHKVEKDRSIILFDSEIVKGSIEKLWQVADQTFPSPTVIRGLPCFFDLDGVAYSFRHFRRGGMVEAVLQDRYLGTGRQNNRAFDEFQLLVWMREQGLPVPQPVAARVQQGSLFYRADLLTIRIPETVSLADFLTYTELTTEQWQKLGAEIAAFHRAGIFHADLNAGNILLDESGCFFVIDFDRCCRRTAGPWTAGNLKRLQRSFNKLKSKATGDFHFSSANWQQLQLGYADA